MKWNHALAVALACTLAPASGWAADLKGGLGGEVEFDSNARRTETNEQKDVIFRVSPWVELREDEGKFNYDVRYKFPWEKALEVDRIEGFRHFLNARAEYNFSDRTVLTFTDVFSRSDSVNSIGGTEAGVATVNTFARPVTRNLMAFALAHDFTPRLQTITRLNFRLFDSDLPRRANNRTFGGSIDNRYQLTQRHRVGAGVAVDYQDFDSSNDGSRTPSQTLFANVFGSWNWFFDENTTLEIAAGPTFIDTNQDSPASTTTADGVPLFTQDPADGILLSDLESCVEEDIDGSTVQIIRGSTVACPRFGVFRQDSFDLSDGRSDTYAGAGYDAVEVQNDLQSILDARNQALLDFSPGSPTSLSSTSWTIFAQAALTRRWTPNVVSTASYTRRDSTASGIAGSAVLDAITLRTNWQITELWSAAFRADWTHRESTSPVDQLMLVVDDTGVAGAVAPLTSGAFTAGGLYDEGIAYNASYTTRRVNQSIDTTRWGVQARIRRRFTRNLSSGLRYTFNRQTSEVNTAGGFSDFDNHLITLNVQYDFDRWNLW